MSKKTINAGKHCKYGACQKPAFSRGFCRYHYRIEHDEGGLSQERKLKKELDKKEEKEKKRLQVLSSLSDEELRTLFLTPCKTRQELMNFVKFFFGLHLPDQIVSRFADTTPFDVVWEVYDICVNKRNPEDIKDLLYVAGRGSGKTLGMALAELLVVMHDHRDVVHVGAILNQAKRCYEYQQKFLLNDKIRPIVSPPRSTEDERILVKSTMDKSAFRFGSETVSLEVLPCTLKACLVPSHPLGDKNAGDIQVGDYLNSPDGMVKVISNNIELRECISVELDNGIIIEGTLDHKVWTNVGWVELQNLDDTHEILIGYQLDGTKMSRV